MTVPLGEYPNRYDGGERPAKVYEVKNGKVYFRRISLHNGQYKCVYHSIEDFKRRFKGPWDDEHVVQGS